MKIGRVKNHALLKDTNEIFPIFSTFHPVRIKFSTGDFHTNVSGDEAVCDNK